MHQTILNEISDKDMKMKIKKDKNEDKLKFYCKYDNVK